MGITNALSLSRFQSPRQELSCCWVEFPNSAYGIAYHLKYPVTTKYFSSFIDGSAKTPTGRKFKWKTKHNSSSFECLLESLNLITIRYPVDTALLYIREIIEPGDLEYGLFVGGTRSIEASRLSEKQVSRLRIMILPKRREDILVSYLHQYKMLKFSSRFLSKVVKDFATFQQKYSKSTSLKEKFDLLFGFSYAIHKYSAWMYRYERSRSREKVLSALARYWRHILRNNFPEELGLDIEFSYPAVCSFLDSMKGHIENIDMHDLPSLSFVFESPVSPKMATLSNGSLISSDEYI